MIMFSKKIILFAIAILPAMVSPVKSLDGSSSFSLLSDIINTISNNGSSGGSSAGWPTSGCLARDHNCIYLKLCNLAQAVYAILAVSPLISPIIGQALPCVQANGSGQLAFDPISRNLILNLNVDKIKASQQDKNTGFCECTVCNETCGNIFLNRCNTKTCQSPKYQMSSSATTTPILAGTGGICVSSSSPTRCLAIIFCGIKFNILGDETELGSLPIFCGEGQLYVNTADNALVLGLSDFQITVPSSLSNENCPCSACAGPCADNPLLGCPRNETYCT